MLLKGEILMILDADLTVIPEELPYFYEAITKNRGDFINGSRLVYPMHDEAMRFLMWLEINFSALLFPTYSIPVLKIPCAVQKCCINAITNA